VSIRRRCGIGRTDAYGSEAPYENGAVVFAPPSALACLEPANWANELGASLYGPAIHGSRAREAGGKEMIMRGQKGERRLDAERRAELERRAERKNAEAAAQRQRMKALEKEIELREKLLQEEQFRFDREHGLPSGRPKEPEKPERGEWTAADWAAWRKGSEMVLHGQIPQDRNRQAAPEPEIEESSAAELEAARQRVGA